MLSFKVLNQNHNTNGMVWNLKSVAFPFNKHRLKHKWLTSPIKEWLIGLFPIMLINKQ